MLEQRVDASHPALTVDARGMRCPWPALRLARAARSAASGTEIELLADDPAAAGEVAALAKAHGWRLDAAPPIFRVTL